MSRIIVKNLPQKTTEGELRNTFSEKGIVTDVQLKYTKSGKFRHFAFVGYQSNAEAEAAVQYFNQSYFKSLKITVELCTALGDENKPKSWSKYAPDSTAYKMLNQETKENKKEMIIPRNQAINPLKKELVDKLDKFKNDTAFLEFMEVHGKEKSIWGNDDIISFLSSVDKKHASDKKEDCDIEDDTATEETVTKIADDKTVSDADYFKLKTGQKTLKEVKQGKSENKFFTLVIRGLPYKMKKKTLKEFFRPLKVDSIRIPVKIKGLAYVGFKCEKAMNTALLRDRSFIEGKRLFINKLKENISEEALLEENSNEAKWKKQEESLSSEESIAESGRIFVRNLPYTSTEEELQSIFEKYGPVTEVIVPLDKLTRKIKGYGVVTYLIPEHAVKAFTELDGTVFHGRMLHLLPGKAKDSNEPSINEGSSYKSKKLQTLKAESQSAHNWNTLFLGSNAVAETIASNYNISKEQLFSDNNAAVRLALGETQIVHETREFLETNGVELDAFNRAINHRSKTIILVKNLPANTSINEIRDIFSKYGILNRVVLPPSGVTAIVEFVEPAEARTAFKRLAYSRFKNLPLYLEWAPEDTFTISSREKDEQETEKESNDSKKLAVSDEFVEEPEPETTLFVKNLNFETTEEAFKLHFANCGKICSVTIAKKKDPQKIGNLLSMGYGFVQFYKVRSLENALKNMQLSILDGHAIELKRSNRTLKSETHVDRKVNNVEKQTGSKILVRNIPFQAKYNELQELFKVFGEIKALRLPKKMVGAGPHRGFAFVEYYTREEAKRAMQSLCQSTHLYGRRLVLEWAQSAEDDLEQMRKRTAERFPRVNDAQSKKSRADIQIDESESEEEPEMFE